MVKSAKPGKPPPAEPREAVPRGGVCKTGEAPRPRAARSASCPPRGRGNERFLLSFNGRTRSARHRNILRGTLNSAVLHVNFPDSFARHKDSFVPDPRGCCAIVSHDAIRARVRRNDEFSRNFKRAFAIKDNRLSLYKRSVSTSPLPLLLAFPRPFPFRERSAVPRPCLKKQGRAGGVPKGGRGHPWGEPFPTSFPFVRKRGPCGAKTNKL